MLLAEKNIFNNIIADKLFFQTSVKRKVLSVNEAAASCVWQPRGDNYRS